LKEEKRLKKQEKVSKKQMKIYLKFKQILQLKKKKRKKEY